MMYDIAYHSVIVYYYWQTHTNFEYIKCQFTAAIGCTGSLNTGPALNSGGLISSIIITK